MDPPTTAMASSPSRPSHSRSSPQADPATDYSLNLDVLTPSKAHESSLMESMQAIGPAVDVVQSDDIEGPSDFTQNMEFWMRGGKISDTKREEVQVQQKVEHEESDGSSFPEEHANGDKSPDGNTAETINVEEQHSMQEQQLVPDEPNVAAHEAQVEVKPVPLVPDQDLANVPLNPSDYQFKIKELEIQLSTATSTIATLVKENNRLQSERDDANLRRAEAETLRDSFETENEQLCDRVKLSTLQLKHLTKQVERAGIQPAQLMIYVDGLKSETEKSKGQVKELEEKIEQLEERVEQFKAAAEKAQKLAQRQEVINLFALGEANALAEKFERLEAEKQKAVADFERLKSVVRATRTRCEYYKGRFEDVTEKAEYYVKKTNEANAVILQLKEQSKQQTQQAVKHEEITNKLKDRLQRCKIRLTYAKLEKSDLQFDKDEIEEQRDWLSDKCDRYAESLRKEERAQRAATEKEKKTKQELETLKKDFENVSAEMDEKMKELLIQRDNEWIARIQMVDKDRKIMSQALLQEWGKGELGESEPQVYQYQCTDVDQ